MAVAISVSACSANATGSLAERGTISQATLDDAVAAEARALADVDAAEAELRRVDLNLGYTKIRSPIRGRAGKSSVDVGNLIGPDSGSLATVVTLDPMRVVFSLSERVFPQPCSTSTESPVSRSCYFLKNVDCEWFVRKTVWDCFAKFSAYAPLVSRTS